MVNWSLLLTPYQKERSINLQNVSVAVVAILHSDKPDVVLIQYNIMLEI